jgi:hypothetical protein
MHANPLPYYLMAINKKILKLMTINPSIPTMIKTIHIKVHYLIKINMILIITRPTINQLTILITMTMQLN